jgi:sarcosine oxidase, subunit delta
MQVFPCPFCGPRDETEFTFGGEAGKARPEPADTVSAEAWSGFLYVHLNPRGPSREIWRHDPCGEFLLLERDTLSHAVHASHSLRKAPAQGSDAAAPHAGETYGSAAPGAQAQGGGASL